MRSRDELEIKSSSYYRDLTSGPAAWTVKDASQKLLGPDGNPIEVPKIKFGFSNDNEEA